MARRSERRIVEELLDRFEPDVRRAFLEAFDDVTDHVELERLVEALRRGDLNAALAALHVEPAAFRRLQRVIEDAFAASGEAAVASLPPIRDAAGVRVGLRFDPGDEAASDLIRRHGAALVTRIVQDQRDSLRAALAEGLRRGLNPRTIALDIAGRYDRRVGRRVGGIVGLADGQRRAAERALEELLSGDPRQLARYLQRAARDRHFDRTVARAIREGIAIPLEKARRMIERYRDGLLKMRADTIARNETTIAVSQGRQEAIRQTLQKAGIRADLVQRTWRATHDKRTRDTHRAMDGQTVQGLDTPFVSPSGAMLRFPGDPEAPLAETIQCRCVVTTRILKAPV